MKDGTDAVSDWPYLMYWQTVPAELPGCRFIMEGEWAWAIRNMLVWSLSRMARTALSACIKRVLFNDPALGVIRHADAGYEQAQKLARQAALNTF